MRKDDVEFHSEGFGTSRPAVNVKVNLPWDWSALQRTVAQQNGVDPDAFAAWWEAHEDELDTDPDIFGDACSDSWEYLQDAAETIFGKGTKVYSEGRSGGWAIVNGIEDAEGWDAIALGRWAQFGKIARALADDVPYQMVSLVLLNLYEPQVPTMIRTEVARSQQAIGVGL